MFDKHFISITPRSQAVYVTEKRAPTDESVRLLKEMESAARAKVVESVRVERNGIKAVFQRSYDDMNAEHLYWIFCGINGEKRKVIVRNNKGRIDEMEHDLWRALADDMAAAILGSVVK